jgi:hypothetical protein
MTAPYAPLALLLPRPLAIRMATRVGVLWSAAMRGLRAARPSHAVAWRNVDAVDGLDERTLKDIGAGAWNAALAVQRDRDAMLARIDAERRW